MSELELVAFGARTSIGLTAESTAAAVRAGISGYGEIPFAGPSGQPLVAAMDPRIDQHLEGPERLVALVQSVLEEVFAKLENGVAYQGVHHFLVALPEARPGFVEADAALIVGEIRRQLEKRGKKNSVDLVGRGHAGGIAAIERAVYLSASNGEGLFFVLGVDSYCHGETYLWLERERRIAQPEIRGGFFPGEGVGCLVLATPILRRRLRLPQCAIVRGVRTARETLLRESETGSFGVGMSEAVEGALAGMDLPRDGVDTVYTDINGERYRSEEWGFVAMRTYQAWKSLVYEAPSDCWGDVGAAFGPLATILATQAFARKYARGPRAMVLGGSDSGLRGAVLLDAPRTEH